jgi:hypothetical protein
MTVLADYWTNLICLAVTLVFVNGAITGRFYSHGRGGPPKSIAFVRSPWTRIAFLFVATGLVAWLIMDLRHKFGVQ